MKNVRIDLRQKTVQVCHITHVRATKYLEVLCRAKFCNDVQLRQKLRFWMCKLELRWSYELCEERVMADNELIGEKASQVCSLCHEGHYVTILIMSQSHYVTILLELSKSKMPPITDPSRDLNP